MRVRPATTSLQKSGWLACVSLILISLPVCAQTPPQVTGPVNSTPILSVQPEYQLGPGDEISVSFPYNAELNHDGPIGPDGRFTLPLVGNLPLAGQTISQATETITRALHDGGIVSNASTSLTIRRYGVNVFVGGEVRAPGVVQLSAGMDALQAVIVAGGMLDTAKTSRIAIIRRNADNHAVVTYVDLKQYAKGNPAGITAMLEPRDVIFVPRSKIAEVDRWVDNYINKTIPFQRSFGYNLGNYGTTTTTVAK